MKKSVSQLAQVTAERLSQDNIGVIAKELWWTLIKSKQLGKMEYLIEEIEKKISKKNNKIRAKITFASEPTKQNIEEIELKLKKMFAKDIDINTTVDPSLLGGFKISVDDLNIDLSYREKIKRLKLKLAGVNE